MRKKIHIMRHAHSSHLVSGFKGIMNVRDYFIRQNSWQYAEFTEKGKRQMDEVVKKVKINFNTVFSSPVKRCIETAKYFKEESEIIIDKRLIEVQADQMTAPGFFKMSPRAWIIYFSFVTLFRKRVIDILRETKEMMFQLAGCNGPVLAVSHEFRMIIFYLIAKIHPRWKVIKKDFSTTGFLILEYKNK